MRVVKKSEVVEDLQIWGDGWGQVLLLNRPNSELGTVC